MVFRFSYLVLRIYKSVVTYQDVCNIEVIFFNSFHQSCELHIIHCIYVRFYSK